MKKKNVCKFVALNILGSLIITPNVIAGITSSRTSGGAAGGTSSTTITKPGKTVDEKVDIKEGTASVSCKQDPNESKYFPLDFFQHITRDGSPISFETRADNKIVVQIPASIDSCGKFKPQLIQNQDNIENVVVAMTLDNGKTYGEFIKCLEEKSILVGGKIDHDKIEGKEYSDYSYVLDYKFDRTKDIQKTIKMSYGYPKAFSGKDGYGSTFGIDKEVDMPSSLCMLAEKVSPTSTFLNKGKDILLQELTSICKNGSAQEIADARKSLGNADALKDIAEKLRQQLDAGYLVAVQKDVERITTEMDKIEAQINKEKDSMDEKTAKNIARKYSELTKELDNLYFKPAIKHLDELMLARASMEDGEARDKLDEEIRLLNADIGKFSARNQTAFANLYGLMEKFALTDSAKQIEEIRLKSYVYSRVFAGSKTDKRGTPMTFEEANKKQVSILQTFDKTMNDWTDQYLVGQGNLYPIKKTEKERQAVVNKMNTRWQKYQEDEEKTYKKHCTGIFGASNPVRCKEFMSGAEQRRAAEVKRWQKDNQYVTSRNAKLERMGGNYNAYLTATAEQRNREAESYNPYGSYATFDDNFEGMSPMYQAPTSSSSGYEAWRYSMAGQQQMQQQQYPMMYNAQMPVQQGQYQMQQPMTWASM